MDRDGFKKVWLPLGSAFYKVAYSILCSEDDAKDAVQDLYVKLWNSRERLDSVRNAKAYGITMTKNICMDRLTGKERHMKNAGQLDSLHSGKSGEVPVHEEPDRRIIGKEAVSVLDSVMERLPAKQVEVIRMRFFDDLSYKEIEQRTGLSAVNIRVLVTRARSTISAKLKGLI